MVLREQLITNFNQGMSHVREARLLCRKTVDLFTLLSHTQETGARRIGMTQELLALVTGLAHYLKILIRIALTGALKLEREQQQAASGPSNGSNGSIVPMGGDSVGKLGYALNSCHLWGWIRRRDDVGGQNRGHGDAEAGIYIRMRGI